MRANYVYQEHKYINILHISAVYLCNIFSFILRHKLTLNQCYVYIAKTESDFLQSHTAPPIDVINYTVSFIVNGQLNFLIN